MIDKIINIDKADEVSSKLRTAGKKIVLAGGCFDILHVGHIQFFKRAKEHGDILMVMLESDERIQKLKGNNRPINTQLDRARILAALTDVDYVIVLASAMANTDYDSLILSIKPAIIATTKADPGREHKDRQGKILGIPVVDVIDRIENQATSQIAQLLRKDL